MYFIRKYLSSLLEIISNMILYCEIYSKLNFESAFH